jgi:hypothetical protein
LTYDERFTSIPEGWEALTEQAYEAARVATMEALHHDTAVDRHARYYAREGDFAGTTFLTIGPCDPYRFTSGDLLALTLLQVQVSPAVVRRLTEPSRTGERLMAMLQGQHLTVNADLTLADEATMQAMADFHVAVKPALSAGEAASANPWVTASKLTARKRPDLFPVRDSVVCELLGLSGRKQNYEVDWQVYRRLLQDDVIRNRLDQVVDDAAAREGVDVGSPMRRLRHLDVVLWMHARRGADQRTTEVS